MPLRWLSYFKKECFLQRYSAQSLAANFKLHWNGKGNKLFVNGGWECSEGLCATKAIQRFAGKYAMATLFYRDSAKQVAVFVACHGNPDVALMFPE